MRDSCEKSGLWETPQERKRRGGSPTARGKRVSRNGNQQTCLTEPKIKTRIQIFVVLSSCYT
nr:hypothetical protein [Bacillus mesophilus]